MYLIVCFSLCSTTRQAWPHVDISMSPPIGTVITTLTIAFGSKRHSYVKGREAVWTSFACGLSWQVLIEANWTLLTQVVFTVLARTAPHCRRKVISSNKRKDKGKVYVLLYM